MTVAYPANISFLYDNVVFDATTITAGSEVPTMPAANLRYQERGSVWRTTDHENETLLLALAEAKAFNLLGLVDHNLTAGATVRVQANTSNSFGGTTPYDETFTIGADLAEAVGYEAPQGKVAPPDLFFLDNLTTRVASDAVLLGADDAYSAADHADFKPTGDFTIAIWFKRESPPTADECLIQSFAAAGGVAAGFKILVKAVTGGISFVTSNNSSATSTVTKTMNYCDGKWHLFVFGVNGTEKFRFFDGIYLITSTTPALPAYQATNYVRMGCANNTGTNINFFNGLIGDVAIYNGTALSAAQINDIYNNGITELTNLKAWYKFTAGALTTDSSGNSHTLTAISVPVSVPGGGPLTDMVNKYPYVKFTFADPLNTDGYIQLGKLWLGEYLESETQYSYGARERIVDPSTVARSMGGQPWPDEEDMYMVVSLSISHMTDEVKFWDFRQLLFAVRTTRFFILMLNPGTAQGRVMQSAYGRFTDNAEFTLSGYDNNAVPLTFEEVR